MVYINNDMYKIEDKYKKNIHRHIEFHPGLLLFLPRYGKERFYKTEDGLVKKVHSINPNISSREQMEITSVPHSRNYMHGMPCSSLEYLIPKSEEHLKSLIKAQSDERWEKVRDLSRRLHEASEATSKSKLRFGSSSGHTPQKACRKLKREIRALEAWHSHSERQNFLVKGEQLYDLKRPFDVKADINVRKPNAKYQNNQKIL